MSLQTTLSWLRGIILAIAVVSTTYLYLYPYHLGCAFPSITGSIRDGFTHTLDTHLSRDKNDSTLAPFRLLILADPQLEGDSSLPDPEDALLARLRAHGTRIVESIWTNVTIPVIVCKGGVELEDVAAELSLLSDAVLEQNVLTAAFNETKEQEIANDTISLNETAQETTVVSDGAAIFTIASNDTSPSHVPTDSTAATSTEQLDAEERKPEETITVTRFTPFAPFSTFLTCLTEVIFEDIPRSLWAIRKTIDLFGNDYYLAHIYRTLNWWSNPTHVTVLGDLVGSQWVNDEEFSWRSWRFWNRVFAGSRQVSQEAMNMHLRFKEDQKKFDIDDTWRDQIINIAGNHDIGYAGDISRARLDRFEREFGKVNWDVKFVLPQKRLPHSWRDAGREAPKIQLIVLNSMLLDTPALDGDLQSSTYEYINGLIGQRIEPVEARNTTFTLLLTHVPLHKPEGVCVDAPMFEFWDFEDADGAFKNGGLKEQNHLSDHTSHQGVLQTIFGMSGDLHTPINGKGRNGLILNGHDHEGCDSVHYIERSSRLVTFDSGLNEDTDSTRPSMDWTWKSVRTGDFSEIQKSEQPGKMEIVSALREITMRSMMGEYSGNAGLMSVWFDFEQEIWEYEIMMCPVGVQHIWWAVHVVDMIALVVLITMPFIKFKTGQVIQPSEVRPTRKESISRAFVNGNRKATLDVPRPVPTRSPSQGRRKG